MVSLSNRAILQSILVADYNGLVRRLTRRFGSPDFASETLHETFAQLERIGDETVVLSPKDYLFRTAINVGKNLQRSERLRASASDIDALLDVPDETPLPEQIVAARSDMDELVRALDELPLRVRQVFEAVFFANKPYAQIAQQFGVSTRTVERDVQHAVEHCSRQVGHLPTRR
jgi:RNA polymerase sigma-70 factor, ECF subfamily